MSETRIRRQWSIGTGLLGPLKASLAIHNCTLVYEEKQGFWDKILSAPIVSVVVEGTPENLTKVSNTMYGRAWI